MKKIVILGSTGSIGRQTIDVIKAHADKFQVIGLAARGNVEGLAAQIIETGADHVCLADNEAAQKLKECGFRGVELNVGAAGLEAMCEIDDADIVLNAVVGSDGLRATLAALEAGKQVALANKESLVAAGELVVKTLAASRGSLVPVDSEHNAIRQCLLGERIEDATRLILTASGGPFWGRDAADTENVTPSQALAHPRWRMGPRITIDSATLINKGFEVIEAHYLFGVGYDRIDVLIHPQSIVHSMVEFNDHSIKAHLGPTDMRLPILYSLAWPQRAAANYEPLDFMLMNKLEFHVPDITKIPCLNLAINAAKEGRSYTTVLNAADEIGVAAFLDGRIGFNEIGNIIDIVLGRHEPMLINSFADFSYVDDWARRTATEIVVKCAGS